MRHAFLVLGLILLVAAGALALTAGNRTASAELKNTKGESVGKVTLSEGSHGVVVHAELKHLAPGTHGFHIHSVGQCTPPFATAGGHFNPANKKHGILAPMGMHAGDLPNVVVGADGTATVDFFAMGLTLVKAAPSSLMDADGSSFVIHEKADDYTTDPAGASGDRIACGVVVAGAS